MTERYLEDFTVGQTFGSGRLRIDEEQIRRFASAFDPQPPWPNSAERTRDASSRYLRRQLRSFGSGSRPA